MKILTTAAVILAMATQATAQILPVNAKMEVTPEKAVDSFHVTVPKTVLVSLGAGIGNSLKNDFSVPAGFQLKNATGSIPFIVTAEYLLNRQVGIGAVMETSTYWGNYYQLFYSGGNTYYRSHSNQVNTLAFGLYASYHLGKYIKVKRLDPYVSLGVMSLSSQQDRKPQGDSIVSTTDRNVNLYARLGARYYISKRAAFYADFGISKQAIATVGFTCRFRKLD